MVKTKYLLFKNPDLGMATVDKKLSLAVGVLIVIFIGLNLALVFTNNFGRVSTDVLTGATTILNSCYDTVGGIQCSGELFELKMEGQDCAVGTYEGCTNSCQLSKEFANDDRACPNYCKNYCVPSDILMKLQ